ncbi:IucA/IucC family protein [Rhizobium sp. CF080]|nr:IucA/IucC family protein [Rhizobium sp. CF080]
MNVWDTWSWSKSKQISTRDFKTAYNESLYKCISGIICSLVHEDKWGIWSTVELNGEKHVKIGRDPSICCRVVEIFPFGKILFASPFLFCDGEISLKVSTVNMFCNSLVKLSLHTEFENKVSYINADFQNSFANMLFNTLLHKTSPHGESAIECAHEGHHYYPFPALRVGPNSELVEACSPVTGHVVQLPVFAMSDAIFRSQLGLTEAESRMLWGAGQIIPTERPQLIVHPWQLKLSHVVQALVSERHLVKVGTIPGIPLASQRTFRLDGTKFDVKLPINATITGEHRLIYGKNLRYSQVTSCIARHSNLRSPFKKLGFQYDTSTLGHRNEIIGQHACMIVRAPVDAMSGAEIIPAINIFCSPEAFAKFVKCKLSSLDVTQFLERYINVLIEAGLYAFSKLRLALEPHLQNSIIEIHDGLPVRLIVRDMDSVILDRDHDYGISEIEAFDADLSDMPHFSEGGRRLLFSMFFGHLAQVIFCAVKTFGIRDLFQKDLLDCAWAGVVERLEGDEVFLARQLRQESYFRKDILTSRIARDMQTRWSLETNSLDRSFKALSF